MSWEGASNGGGGGTGWTSSVAERVSPANAAVITTEVAVATGRVVALNEAPRAPGATVTIAGTCTTSGWLLVRVTIRSSCPAGQAKVTCPVDCAPPTKLSGIMCSAAVPPGRTVMRSEEHTSELQSLAY